MKPALIIINEKLLESGMDQVEIDHLMARFLEEEAQEYVECIDLVKDHIQCKEDIVIH